MLLEEEKEVVEEKERVKEETIREELKIGEEEKKEKEEKINESNSKDSLWEYCTELCMRGRNGSVEAFYELEEISKNDDLVCMIYYCIILRRDEFFFFIDKYLDIANKISKKIYDTITYNYLKNVTNKYEQCAYAALLREGIGFEKDYEESFRLLKLSADQGYVLAESTLGYCYNMGEGTPKNYELSVLYTSRAAEKGNSIAAFNMGYYYERAQGVAKDLNKAFHWYQKSALQSYPCSQLALGRLYRVGLGVSPDPSLSFYWYKMAADGGDVFAMNQMGLYYTEGKCVEKNEVEGQMWYNKELSMKEKQKEFEAKVKSFFIENTKERTKKSAENGFPKSQYTYGTHFFSGERKVDEQESVKWAQLAAEQENLDGMLTIGLCYYYGRVLERDRKKSLKWLENDVTKQEAYAKLLLIFHYLQERNDPSMQSTAYEYIKQLSEDPDFRYCYALYIIGIFYEYGIGVQRDETKTFNKFSNAMRIDPSFGYDVGRCYEEGIGVPVNLVQSKRLFTEAARWGNIDAQNKLREYEEDKVEMKITKKR